MNKTTMLSVELSGGRSYPIHIGPDLIAQAGTLIGPLARGGRAVIITQPRIGRLYSAAVAEPLRTAGLEVSVVSFGDGERFKTLRTVERLYDALYTLRADRKTLIIALGGGVVGDVAGWVAASYLRGLDYAQIPTTLLAMVDSSVGGKTGVDFRDGKNLIGAFHQPRIVLADTNVLRTLPARDFRSGLAEVLKYGVIRDPELLDFVGDRVKDIGKRVPDALRHVAERSCAIKAEVVAGDEREETGLRAILNFGHTIGHALEAATRYRRFRHGEAVAIGMVSAACVGEAARVTPREVRQAIAGAIRAQRLPIAIPEDVPVAALTALFGLDKKAERGRARWVLARGLGVVDSGRDLDEKTILAGLSLQARLYGNPAAVVDENTKPGINTEGNDARS